MCECIGVYVLAEYLLFKCAFANVWRSQHRNTNRIKNDRKKKWKRSAT